MFGPAYRIAIISALALLSVAFVIAAVVLLIKSNDNASVQVIAPSTVRLSPVISQITALLPYQIQPNPNYGSTSMAQCKTPGYNSLQPGDRLVDALEATGSATAERPT